MAYAQWNPNTTYIVNDIIEYNGFIYRATVINQNVTPEPTTATWTKIGGSSGGGIVNSITAGNPNVTVGGTTSNPVLFGTLVNLTSNVATSNYSFSGNTAGNPSFVLGGGEEFKVITTDLTSQIRVGATGVVLGTSGTGYTVTTNTVTPASTNDQQVATTSFVQSAIAASGGSTLSAVLTAGNTATNSILLNNTGTGTNVISLLPNFGATTPHIELTDGTTTNIITKNGYTTRNSNQNSTHFLNFSDTSTTGQGAIQKTAGITCNPSTNTVSATTFVGALTGTASTATCADKVDVKLQTLDGTFNLGMFAGVGCQDAKIVSGLTYQNDFNELRTTALVEGTYTHPLFNVQCDKATDDGPYIDLYANKPSISATDDLGAISFSGNGNGGSNTRMNYGQIQGQIRNKQTAGTIAFKVLNASVLTTSFEVEGEAVRIVGGLRDSGGQIGTFGQVLSSTGTQVDWIDLIPVGTVQMYAGTSAPAGNWKFCDGTSYSTSAPYNLLFAVIGYNFGGSGANFNVPNFDGNLMVGTSSATPSSAEQTGTVDAYTTANWQDAHLHTVDPPNTNSGTPSANVTVQSGTGITVANNAHTHATNIASFNSGSTTIDLSGLKRSRIRYIIKY
jgi:hypothetical protein